MFEITTMCYLPGRDTWEKTTPVELGRRLELERWEFLFADVEAATCAEDAIADIAKAAYPIRPIISRFVKMY